MRQLSVMLHLDIPDDYPAESWPDSQVAADVATTLNRHGFGFTVADWEALPESSPATTPVLVVRDVTAGDGQ